MNLQFAADMDKSSPTNLIFPLDSLARLISDVLCPPVVAAISIIVSAAHLATPSAWKSAALFLTLTVVIPTLYILWLLYRGKVTDFHLRVREQRIKPMILIAIMTVSAWLALIIRQAPVLLIGIATAGMVMTIILLVITLRWKISGHTTAMSAFVVLCWWFAGVSAAPITLTVPLVAWARVRIRRHTPAQVIAGVVLGLMTSLVICATY